MTTATFREFAAIVGCRPSYVTQLKKDGRLVLTEDGKRVEVEASRQLIEDTRDPSKAGVVARHAKARAEQAATSEAPDDTPENNEENDVGIVGGYDFQQSRAKKEHFAALQAEAEYRKTIKELLEASAVRAVLADIVTVLRSSLESMPHTLAPVLSATQGEAEIKALLHDHIEAALRDASERLEQLGKGDVTA